MDVGRHAANELFTILVAIALGVGALSTFERQQRS